MGSGKELTPYLRGRIEGMKESGKTVRQIAEAVHLKVSTVKTTLRRLLLRSEGISRPRSGRPYITDARTNRRLLFIVKRNPDATYAKIREDLGVKVSDSTIYRILQNFHIEHWIKKKRPLLDADHAKARLKWCLAVKDWTWSQWFKVIFTDECSLKRGSGKLSRPKHGRQETNQANKEICIWHVTLMETSQSR